MRYCCEFGLILAAGAVVMAAPLASAFTAEEVIVANPDLGMPDPEFDQIGYQVTWRDKSGTLWVAPVDPATRNFRIDQAEELDHYSRDRASYDEKPR